MAGTDQPLTREYTFQWQALASKQKGPGTAGTCYGYRPHPPGGATCGTKSLIWFEILLGVHREILELEAHTSTETGHLCHAALKDHVACFHQRWMVQQMWCMYHGEFSKATWPKTRLDVRHSQEIDIGQYFFWYGYKNWYIFLHLCFHCSLCTGWLQCRVTAECCSENAWWFIAWPVSSSWLHCTPNVEFVHPI